MKQEIEKLQNKIRQAYQDLGYAKARMKIAQDKIKYFEEQLMKLNEKKDEA